MKVIRTIGGIVLGYGIMVALFALAEWWVTR